MEQHRAKRGAKYIKYFPSFELVYKEEYQSRTDAMRREMQLKGWSRVKKEALINHDSISLKKLSKSTKLVDVRTG